MWNKRSPESVERAVMSLYCGAWRKVRVESELSKEFLVQVGVDQGSILSLLLFVIVVDVITGN